VTGTDLSQWIEAHRIGVGEFGKYVSSSRRGANGHWSHAYVSWLCDQTDEFSAYTAARIEQAQNAIEEENSQRLEDLSRAAKAFTGPAITNPLTGNVGAVATGEEVV